MTGKSICTFPFMVLEILCLETDLLSFTLRKRWRWVSKVKWAKKLFLISWEKTAKAMRKIFGVSSNARQCLHKSICRCIPARFTFCQISKKECFYCVYLITAFLLPWPSIWSSKSYPKKFLGLCHSSNLTGEYRLVVRRVNSDNQ